MRTPIDPTFWRGTRILPAGHAGFKGDWMAAMPAHFSARVTGLALALDTDPNLFRRARRAPGWGDHLAGDAAVRAAADWYLAVAPGDDMAAFTRRSIEDHLG